MPRIAANSSRDREPDVAAYEHYLVGLDLLHRRDTRAKDEFRKAIDLDPDFAGAHAEYAINLLIGNPSADEIEAADQAIEKGRIDRLF